jgi:hypothetical protein
MSEAVLDAGPLIHLAELDALDTLMDFSALFIPMVVQEEVECHRIKVLDFGSMKSDAPSLPSHFPPQTAISRVHSRPHACGPTSGWPHRLRKFAA